MQILDVQYCKLLRYYENWQISCLNLHHWRFAEQKYFHTQLSLCLLLSNKGHVTLTCCDFCCPWNFLSLRWKEVVQEGKEVVLLKEKILLTPTNLGLFVLRKFIPWLSTQNLFFNCLPCYSSNSSRVHLLMGVKDVYNRT